MGKNRLAIMLSGIEQEYQREIARGIREEARAQGLAVYFFSCQGIMDNALPTSAEAEADIFRLPDLNRFDGAIVLRATISNPLALMALGDALQNAPDLPRVLVDEHRDDRLCVGFEDAHCVQAMTEHLIAAHGAKRLCFVAGVQDNAVSLARQREFEQTLAAHGLPFGEEQLFVGEYLREGGMNAARYFFREGARRPDAVVCANDQMALGLCEALEQMGLRVPEDVRVTGFDCIEEARTNLPSLTTVRRPVYEAGRETVRLLAAKLAGGAPPAATTLVDEVVFGQSCGCGSPSVEQRARYTRDLRAQVRRVRDEYARANALSQLMSGTRGFDDYCERIDGYACANGFTRLYVAVTESFAGIRAGVAGHMDDAARRYAPAMRLAYGLDGGARLPECVFETSRLLPMGCEPDEAVFLPLHADGRNFGYVAMGLDTATHFSVYTLLPSLGNTLENMRLHATIREYANALERMYVHDSLTGLLNRRGYVKYADEMFKEAVERNEWLMVVCADMDSLKNVNDTYGHGEGDAAIKAMAGCIQRSAGSQDLCIHLSGDEFMVIGLHHDERDMRRFIHSVETAIERYNAVNQKPYRISASFGGYASRPDGQTTLEQMCNLADDEMYRVKKSKHMQDRA